LAATQAQGFTEASAVDGSVGSKAVGQPEKQLAVHLGIARQAESAEQVIGVVNGAVMGADDDAGADWVVVAAVGFTAPGAHAPKAKKNCTAPSLAFIFSVTASFLMGKANSPWSR
jgi:hypothetical protein